MSEMHERLSFIDARPGEVLMGRDRSGTVCIGVDLRGDVVKVELSADWREAVGPHSLPSAVVEAERSASRERVGRQMSAMKGEAKNLVRIPDEDTDRQEPEFRFGEQLSSNDILDILEDYRREAPAMRTAMASLAAGIIEIRDSGGWASAQVQGEVITGFEFTAAGLRFAGDAAIEAAVLRLYQRAATVTCQRKKQALDAFLATARLQTANAHLIARNREKTTRWRG